MLYAILCYHDENVTNSWTKEEDDAVLAKRAVVTKKLAAQGKLGPVARLMPTTAATTIRSGRKKSVIADPSRRNSGLQATSNGTAPRVRRLIWSRIREPVRTGTVLFSTIRR